ncbi:MAG: glycine dehydrogenase (aminomethyl-transferring) [Flavobacteriales bacterium]|nr:MAG: glycine dehydrogenase (aminomethyl-transferring) [Flavobacteriales bacterium]
MNDFLKRHIGPREEEANEMLAAIGVSSVDELIGETVPPCIQLKDELNLPEGISEYEFATHINELAVQNQVFKSYIGLGYYNCLVPPVIKRNILENPGWYTAYTPYQSEISQGRLEGLLNFQTMVSDLTAMPIANASLLDEATAAAEAMIMFFNIRSREQEKNGVNKFFVSEECFLQTIDVLKGRAKHLGIKLEIGNHRQANLDENYFGTLVQYPSGNGEIYDYSEFVENAHSKNLKVAVAADLLSLALLKPPGEWGADAVVGSTQRFGVPMGYGGPHAAFFATKEEFKRNIPGRIIGVSVDREGNHALRMALQTREQHIRRDKATSNICTAQALLAIMAGMYAVYHGHEGIKAIAKRVHQHACSLSDSLEKLGFEQLNEQFFDTIKVKLPDGISSEEIKKNAEENQINFRYIDEKTIGISLDETTSEEDLIQIVELFPKAISSKSNTRNKSQISNQRQSLFLTHPVFNSYHSETEMMRYLKRLENKDISLTHSMISLGSCTMKLNAASELYPISIPQFANIHPFAPIEQTNGYQQVFRELGKWLCTITGFDAVSLQPNSGAQGEYAGLLVIKAFHESNGESQRNIALIPASAHGTNPASAVMAGMKVLVVKCDKMGNIDLDDLKAKADQHKNELAAFMVTYPSTHGVFEESIMEITHIIHENGGQVYMDGANMNAQVGLTNPATIGADVCHLNLHKTFAIPHGGGGPGMGPIAVAKHLAPFLPSNPIIKTGGQNALPAISAAPWGSALILLISYGYIKMLGKSGNTNSTKMAILNANYLKSKLEKHYDILYQGKNGRIAHEMIVDCRNFKRSAGIEVADIAKRLIDYGFHAPTVSFPVAGTFMVEPTESESKEELDRFCDAMITIREEIKEIEDGIADTTDNVLKNAPHTAATTATDNWNHSYSREKAVFPLGWVRERKYWPPVSRIDNAYGDRNLICNCPAIESYEAEIAEHTA